ncbi:MAG TPA: hypothetical protein DF613_12565 [Lachnospiraceae bacterium]|nr:hypothetical protein [Lachnospiraceae bacterium]
MMHILLMILKIIGIILLAVAGLLLLMLLLVFFCPVAYRGRFTRKAGSMTGSVSVTWLFRLVWVTASYDNGNHGFRIRIFGIPLDVVSGWLAGRRDRKAGNPGNPGKKPDNEKEKNTDCTEETTDLSSEKKSGRTEKKPFILVRIWRRIVSFFRLLAGLPKRILQSIRSFFQKVSDILKKIVRFRELLFSEEFISAFGLLRGSTGKLLRHIRPRKIRGYFKFGFEDPYHTGLCLGAISVIYPWYHKTLKIEPDFQHRVLEADLYLRGRVFGVYALYIFIKVYFDKNIKYMIRKFRDKEAR